MKFIKLSDNRRIFIKDDGVRIYGKDYLPGMQGVWATHECGFCRLSQVLPESGICENCKAASDGVMPEDYKPCYECGKWGFHTFFAQSVQVKHPVSDKAPKILRVLEINKCNLCGKESYINREHIGDYHYATIQIGELSMAFLDNCKKVLESIPASCYSNIDSDFDGCEWIIYACDMNGSPIPKYKE